jgi:prepilin-type processing-associated H-X9-DG protein
MTCVESRAFSADYLDPAKRSIGNAVQVFFADGSVTENIGSQSTNSSICSYRSVRLFARVLPARGDELLDPPVE